jgi:hypothetical protein
MAGPSKRPLENDAEEAPAAKRGRGRPRKDANANANAPQPPPTKDTTAPKQGRGRPRKDASVAPATASASPAKSAGAGRGRGRPPKDANATPVKSAGRGRGRPRKDESVVKGADRGRGRPPKDASAAPANGAGRGRGRLKKSDSTASGPVAPSSTKKTSQSTSKGGAELTDIIGTYDIDCEEVEGNWPDTAEGMGMSITTLPDSKSALVASFNLGIVEGIMLLAADKDTLDRVRQGMEGKSSGKAKTAAVPALKNRTVYFAWRGQDTGDQDEVHPGSNGSQTGSLTFTDDKYTSFQGVGAFPALGSRCDFAGTKTHDEADEVHESWDDYDEEAYDRANRGRWG